MRSLLLLILATVATVDAQAQIAVDLLYGVDRNVESPESELDGMVSGAVEWVFPSGLGIGVGTDHQFESASIAPANHLGWAAYLSTSFEPWRGGLAPFVRAGIGLGRSPCEGDTCGDGAYLRGAAGVRIHLAERVRLASEVGVSRVSRPFGLAGVSLRF